MFWVRLLDEDSSLKQLFLGLMESCFVISTQEFRYLCRWNPEYVVLAQNNGKVLNVDAGSSLMLTFGKRLQTVML